MLLLFLIVCPSLTWCQDLMLQAEEAQKAGDYSTAYLKYQAASESFHESGDLQNYSNAHLSMVTCQMQNGYPFHAKNLAENTLGFLQKELPDDLQLQAKAKTSLALCFLNLGRNDEALEELLEAKALFKEEGIAMAECYNALGVVYWNNGNKDLATQFHEQALKLRRSLHGGNAVQVGDSYNNLGLVYIADDPLQSLIYLKRARGIYESELGEKNQKTANVITNMAFANVQLENYEEAYKLLDRVKLLYNEEYPENHPNQAFILSSIGRVKEAEGDYDEALLLQNQALKTYLSLFGEKHPEVANTYYLIGEIYKKKSAFKAAVSLYQQSIYANLPDQSAMSDYDLPELNNYFNADILLTSLEAKAIALEALHFEKSLNVRDIVGAIDTYRLCDDLITIIRRKRLNEQDKLKLGATARNVYKNGIQLSLIMSGQSFNRRKYQETAFEFCERSKAAVLLEAINESNAKRFAGIPLELQNLEDSLKDEISYLEQLYNQEEKEETKNLLFRYQSAYHSFIQKLEADYPEYFSLKYDNSLGDISDIQNNLRDHQAVLSYFVGDETETEKGQVFIFLITSKSINTYTKTKPEDFDKLVSGLRNGIKYKIENTVGTSSARLFNLLIPDIPNGIKEIVIFPDAILGTIPFEVLKGEAYLVEQYSISYDYSGTLFLLRKSLGLSPSANALLVAPVDFQDTENRMPSLPGTESELSGLKYLFISNGYQPEVRLKANADESSFKGTDFNSYQFIHLATHGQVNESKPALSRIFLNPGQKDDGSLYTGEIYNLELHADLVSLSACETGLGKLAKGEGIVGLSRALQYAGANNILVSLWQVSDASTSQMMVDFYEYYLTHPGNGYNTALREAKLALLASDEYQQPYYWAPFILVGR